MAGRLVLVIGSNCRTLPELSFLPHEARRLYESLLEPQSGDCEPALPGGSLVLDPSAAELDKVIEAAFAAAAAREATLIVAFTGHGATHGDDFYLLATDSPDEPDSRNAYLLGQRIKELLRKYSGVDGLVLLLDTCESGHAAEAAGQGWIKVVSQAERRFELLTATGAGPAYGGCFVKSLTHLIRTGSLTGPDRLGCADVRDPVNLMCTDQQATHTAFTGAAPGSGDPGLYLARNIATAARRVPLDGSVLAGAAAVTARSFQPTASFRQLRELVTAGQNVVVIGPAGRGKTAALTALAQPDAWPRVHGVWLEQTGETVEQVANELATQLSHMFDGYPAAARKFRTEITDEQWQSADAVQRLLTGPLHELGEHVLFVIDSTSAGILDRVTTPLAAVPGVQVVASAYEAADLGEEFTQLQLRPAERDDVARFATRRGLPADVADTLFRGSDGNWAVIALRADASGAGPVPIPEGIAGFHAAAVERALSGAPAWRDDGAAVLAVLAAAGTGPAMPFDVLRGAVARLGGGRSVPRLHDILARLDTLVVHGRTETGGDSYGLRYRTVADYVRCQSVDDFGHTHAAVADAIEEVAPMTDHRAGDPVHDYAGRTEAEHLWQAGRHDEAYTCLERRESLVNAENVMSWPAWLKRIIRDLGDTHPLAFLAAGRHARALGETGNTAEAIELLRELAIDSRSVLGPDDRVILQVEDHLAYWTHRNGDNETARRLFDTLARRCAVLLDEDDPQTLMAQHHLALTTAMTGAVEDALAIWDHVLASRERVLGERHIDTLRTRLNVLAWTAKNGHPPPDLEEFTRLYTILRDTFEENHPETITASYFRAHQRGKRDTVDDLRTALAELSDLYPRSERVHGPKSLWTKEIEKDQREFGVRLRELGQH